MMNTGKALADVVPGLGKFTFDGSLGKIFVTSGTGVVGYRVACRLLEAGHQDVRVGIWKGLATTDHDENEENVQEAFANQIAAVLEAKGAEIVEFDWSDIDSYGLALEGVKSVFCTIPHMKEWSDIFPSFIRTCKHKKIEHFVKISFLRKGEAADLYRKNVPFVKFHSTCDDLLEQAKKDSRISYTLLCTSHLMPTPLIHNGKELREKHKYITASYGMGVNYVSPNDVADAAMVVLLDLKQHRNKAYNITGPGPIRDRDVANLLTTHYGSEIEHIELGYHDYEANVRDRGLPAWLVKDAAEFERMKATGIDEEPFMIISHTEKLLGRKPESFKGYLMNKESMRPGATFP